MGAEGRTALEFAKVVEICIGETATRIVVLWKTKHNLLRFAVNCREKPDKQRRKRGVSRRSAEEFFNKYENTLDINCRSKRDSRCASFCLPQNVPTFSLSSIRTPDKVSEEYRCPHN